MVKLPLETSDKSLKKTTIFKVYKDQEMFFQNQI